MIDLRDIHDDLLKAVGDKRQRLGCQSLTTFFPIRGSASTGELMVVGRAVFGWQKTGWTADGLDSVKRSEIIQEVHGFSTRQDECPMAWVEQEWGRKRKEGYSTSKSAFWRVIRRVNVSKLINGDGAKGWSSKLIWSDLYKVARFDRGNPGPELARAQLDTCKRYLDEEIALWKPKRVLFLTGWDWAEPFLSRLRTQSLENHDKSVQRSGYLEFADGDRAQVLVCVHPQGKKEKPMVDCINRCFKQLESSAPA